MQHLKEFTLQKNCKRYVYNSDKPMKWDIKAPVKPASRDIHLKKDISPACKELKVMIIPCIGLWLDQCFRGYVMHLCKVVIITVARGNNTCHVKYSKISNTYLFLYSKYMLVYIISGLKFTIAKEVYLIRLLCVGLLDRQQMFKIIEHLRY